MSSLKSSQTKKSFPSSPVSGSSNSSNSSSMTSTTGGSNRGSVVVVTPDSMLGSVGKSGASVVVVITGIVDVLVETISLSQLVILLNRPTVLWAPNSSLKTIFILKYESSGTPPIEVIKILLFAPTL